MAMAATAAPIQHRFIYLRWWLVYFLCAHIAYINERSNIILQYTLSLEWPAASNCRTTKTHQVFFKIALTFRELHSVIAGWHFVFKYRVRVAKWLAAIGILSLCSLCVWLCVPHTLSSAICSVHSKFMYTQIYMLAHLIQWAQRHSFISIISVNKIQEDVVHF